MAIEFDHLFPGKLDHDYLHSLLKNYTSRDDRVLAGARVGEDAAVIDMGDSVLISTTDPITFATDSIGYYAVNVNVNDIVCMGATPKWFLAVLLLPEKISKTDVEAIFAQLHQACRDHNIAYIGGHTEVTVDLPRPIVIGQLLGQAPKDGWLKKADARVGDVLVQINRIPIEGTAIMALERGETLREDFSDEFVNKCAKFLYEPGISVRPAADAIRAFQGVHALHDPTEGGLATAVHELAEAANLGCEIDEDEILILPEGKLACDVFGIDPLGCIASGALLAAVAEKNAASIIKKLRENGFAAAAIGKLTEKDEGRSISQAGKRRSLPLFSQDEIVRIF